MQTPPKAVLSNAIAEDQHPGPNPVDDALGDALGDASHKPKHYTALPWRQVPEFVGQLTEREAIAAHCLRFLILTAARSGEARGATWDEIDLDRKVWVVPAERMKAAEEHQVPLSEPALDILKSVSGLDASFIFPSPQTRSRQLSVNAFRPLLARMGREGLTVHGFRSSFRDWCSESAHAPRELAEAALAHKVGDATERAYARSKLLERRRGLLDAWGQYVTGSSGDVVELVRA